MTDTETIPAYLARVHSSAAEKGGDGTRTTREVADYFDLSMGTARRRLHKLWDAGEIEAFDGGASGAMGNAIMWGAKRDDS